MEEFFLFGSILEANMISKSMEGKPVTFEITVGQFRVTCNQWRIKNRLLGEAVKLGGGKKASLA